VHFLTAGSRRPYSGIVIKTLFATFSILTFACASVPTREEFVQLNSTLKALREENARIEQRLQKIENQSVSVRASPAPRIASAARSSREEAMPTLTVVKLKPKIETAPKVKTDIAIEEPAESVLAELKSVERQTEQPDVDDAQMADSQFDTAFELMNTGNAVAGVSQMKQFVTDWPKHAKADNALYYSGLALMTSGEFESGAAQFEQVAAKYPAGDAVIESLSKLAECHAKLKKVDRAKAAWEKIVNTYPGTSAALLAQNKLAQLNQ
jgi:TolA-binding protein